MSSGGGLCGGDTWPLDDNGDLSLCFQEVIFRSLAMMVIVIWGSYDLREAKMDLTKPRVYDAWSFDLDLWVRIRTISVALMCLLSLISMIYNLSVEEKYPFMLLGSMLLFVGWLYAFYLVIEMNCRNISRFASLQGYVVASTLVQIKMLQSFSMQSSFALQGAVIVQEVLFLLVLAVLLVETGKTYMQERPRRSSIIVDDYEKLSSGSVNGSSGLGRRNERAFARSYRSQRASQPVPANQEEIMIGLPVESPEELDEEVYNVHRIEEEQVVKVLIAEPSSEALDEAKESVSPRSPQEDAVVACKVIGYQKSSHVDYLIEIKHQSGATFHIQRRFSEFYSCRKSMKLEFPGVKLPSLKKSRKLIESDGFLHKRMKKLQRFLDAVVGNVEWAESRSFHDFLLG